jgi:hypothetical protein
VAFDSYGNAVTVWQRSNGTNVFVQAASRPAGGAWQQPVNLSQPGQNAEEPELAVDPQGDAVAVWRRSDGSNLRVQAASKPAGGAWQAPVNLSEAGQSATEQSVAFDSQGNAVAVWTRFDGSNYIIQAAFRAAGGAWQEPVNLSQAGQTAELPQVVLDSQGGAFAVWKRSDGTNEIIQAAFRPAGGAWQEPVNLSEAGHNAGGPRVAADSPGDAVAVWQFHNGANEVVQGATRPAGGAWQAPVNLSEPGQNASNSQLVSDSNGNAVAVWRRWDGSNFRVQAASKPAGGVWQAPGVNLSAPGQSAGGMRVASDSQGDKIAVWERFDGATNIVQAAVRPAGGAWQVPANVSEAGRESNGAQVALDAQGNAAAVWQQFDGSNNIVHAAGYDAAGPLLNALAIPSSGVAGQPITFSVSPLDVWSSLGASNWSFGDGARAAGTSLAHTYSAAGSYHVTFVSADALGNLTSASGTIVIAPGAAPASAPAITGATQSHSRWREGSKLAEISRKKRKPPVGTAFSFSLNEQASVSFAFTQRVAGRHVGHSCVAKNRKNARRRSCTRTVTAGVLSFAAHAGTNKVSFQGRISRSQKLKPGRYTLVITAMNAAGARSAPASLSFTIVK